MFITHDQLILQTQRPIDIIDVTAPIRTRFENSRVLDGQVFLFSPHTTAFVCLNEKEAMLQQDMLDFLERLAPPETAYRHNQEPVDGRLNAHSHLLGLFMNASERIPVAGGRLLLGAWQSIFFVDLDGPRPERTLHIQIIGAQ
ncbi:secondary thiamine-phosphate synthase enzyme [Thiocapsa imhoffii]|uniref:Secondary thiamine-phosphate synthase enzyme n=1 Tax=Thiocapsa imhoffii TaxID=382777 RepID=A0A9X0WF99_9GAMM|nr:secondary thiamine-phosphate synthase enzyme YjbQ [Thiocapsa imhoffii]MBK1643435.1 secondary thiamine-phosphate synthase enzyme [Thiocapsa imhoffii]